jgi:uncharacterized membrane protein YheB (UPF0754 family)
LRDVKLVMLSKMKNSISELERNDWKILVRNQLTQKRAESEQAKIAEALLNAVAEPAPPARRFPFIRFV